MAIKIGLECKAYYGTAGTPAATELTNVTDVTVNMEKATADVTIRGNGWRLTKATLKDATVEFEMIWDDEDAAFNAMFDAWMDNTAIALKFLDGAGGSGLGGDFDVINMSQTQALEEAVKATVSVKPTYSTTNMVDWIVGS